MNFFCHGLSDAVEVLVCLNKRIILDSGVQIFELYMEQLALLYSVLPAWAEMNYISHLYVG